MISDEIDTIAFPSNPINGMAFEAEPGIFYQYSSSTNSWARVMSSSKQALVTTTTDGLMSSTDYNKLSGMIIPPPSSTIIIEDTSIEDDVKVSGKITNISQPPTSLAAGEYVDRTSIKMFKEKTGYVLRQDVAVEIKGAGTYTNTTSPSTIAAGTKVDTYFVHVESDIAQTFNGTITFNTEILGVITTSGGLSLTTQIFKYPDVEYGEPADTEVGTGHDNNDSIIISDNLKKITIQTTVTSSDRDQIRIIVKNTPAGKRFSSPIELSTDNFITIDIERENLHENTVTVNFDIDAENLITYLARTGQWKNVSSQGDTGEEGDPGDDGLNSLPIGPYGDDGVDGTAAIWPGSLVEESMEVRKNTNKAIVNIKTQQDATGNYLVIEKGEIGNPYACPDRILPQDVQSQWILCINNDDEPDIIPFYSGPQGMLNEDNTSESTYTEFTYTNPACGIRKITGTQYFGCQSSLYYFNVDDIVRPVYNEWITQLNAVKSFKENQLRSWLQTIANEFSEKKGAICCSMEALESRHRNQDQRRYIEQQWFQSLQANRRAVVTDHTDYQSSGGAGTTTLPTEYSFVSL